MGQGRGGTPFFRLFFQGVYQYISSVWGAVTLLCRRFAALHLSNTTSYRQRCCTARRLHGSYGSMDGFQQAQNESGENRLYEVRNTPASASAEQ